MPSKTEQLISLMEKIPPDIQHLLPLGLFQCHFLDAVDELHEYAFGAAIHRAVWKYRYYYEKGPNIGKIYGTADRLMKHGYISQKRTANPSGAGRSVYVYSITTFGRAAIIASLIMAKAARKK